MAQHEGAFSEKRTRLAHPTRVWQVLTRENFQWFSAG